MFGVSLLIQGVLYVSAVNSEAKPNTSQGGSVDIAVGDSVWGGNEESIDSLVVEDLINKERAKLGLPSLAHNEKLRQSACAKLDDMALKDYWSHDAPDGTEPWFFFNQVGYNYDKAGENLSYGDQSENSVVSGWMGSPSHKENIIAPYTESGVCAKTVANYQGYKFIYITVQHFGIPR